MQMLEIYTADQPENHWQMVSDQVMGGRSQGQMHMTSEGVHLQGQISYENNGGFVQVKWPLKDTSLRTAEFDGVWFVAKAPKKTQVTVVLKSSQLWMPWQSYRAQVELSSDWQRFSIEFEQFTAYKTWTRLKTQRINQFALLLGEQGSQELMVQKFGLFKHDG